MQHSLALHHILRRTSLNGIPTFTCSPPSVHGRTRTFAVKRANAAAFIIGHDHLTTRPQRMRTPALEMIAPSRLRLVVNQPVALRQRLHHDRPNTCSRVELHIRTALRRAEDLAMVDNRSISLPAQRPAQLSLKERQQGWASGESERCTSAHAAH